MACDASASWLAGWCFFFCLFFLVEIEKKIPYSSLQVGQIMLQKLTQWDLTLTFHFRSSVLFTLIYCNPEVNCKMILVVVHNRYIDHYSAPIK